MRTSNVLRLLCVSFLMLAAATGVLLMIFVGVLLGLGRLVTLRLSRQRA